VELALLNIFCHVIRTTNSHAKENLKVLRGTKGKNMKEI
jgi:hypothetical protein